jgi:hypothetical protein
MLNTSCTVVSSTVDSPQEEQWLLYSAKRVVAFEVHMVIIFEIF